MFIYLCGWLYLTSFILFCLNSFCACLSNNVLYMLSSAFRARFISFRCYYYTFLCFVLGFGFCACLASVEYKVHTLHLNPSYTQSGLTGLWFICVEDLIKTNKDGLSNFVDFIYNWLELNITAIMIGRIFKRLATHRWGFLLFRSQHCYTKKKCQMYSLLITV